ncbi:hypothetical protein MSG28_011254 [Choristoneura fumiferana]|uniref:Uncharacterized protein n=1 Tax=Choristoneura fumiferana TaxID=7141 RepID=A0ACC0KRM8_CHOFU|nr:hypothetical protein MSG28_011254 [Choristoneura fumiferana]
MVKAWYMDNKMNDPRLDHHKYPPKFISQNELYEKTGVEYFKLNIDTLETDGVLDKIKKERDYKYEDELVILKECLPDYEERLKAFYTEHLHPDEEIRLVLEGSGYFDVRDRSDQWIRIEFRTGDMIILPSGIYHRFTLDFTNYIKLKRIFSEEPQWVSYNRPADDMTCRKEYVRKLAKGFIAVASQ